MTQQKSAADIKPEQTTKKYDPKEFPEGYKLFIGGISQKTSEEDFKAFFEKFGKIEDFNIMKNPETGECRGFGFVTFEQRDAYDEVLRSKNQLLLDQRNLDPKPAVPKNLRSSTLDRNGSRNRGRGAFRGRGGGFNDRSRIGFNSVGGFSTTGGANMAPSYGSFPRNNVASQQQPQTWQQPQQMQQQPTVAGGIVPQAGYGQPQVAAYGQQNMYSQPQSYQGQASAINTQTGYQQPKQALATTQYMQPPAATMPYAQQPVGNAGYQQQAVTYAQPAVDYSQQQVATSYAQQPVANYAQQPAAVYSQDIASETAHQLQGNLVANQVSSYGYYPLQTGTDSNVSYPESTVAQTAYNQYNQPSSFGTAVTQDSYAQQTSLSANAAVNSQAQQGYASISGNPNVALSTQNSF